MPEPADETCWSDEDCMDWWHQHQDRAVVVAPFHSRLIPLTPEWLADQVYRPVDGGEDRG